MRRTRRIVRGGATRKKFFLVEEGREDPNITISRQSSARQRNASWRADDGPTLNLA